MSACCQLQNWGLGLILGSDVAKFLRVGQQQEVDTIFIFYQKIKKWDVQKKGNLVKTGKMGGGNVFVLSLILMYFQLGFRKKAQKFSYSFFYAEELLWHPLEDTNLWVKPSEIVP